MHNASISNRIMNAFGLLRANTTSKVVYSFIRKWSSLIFLISLCRWLPRCMFGARAGADRWGRGSLHACVHESEQQCAAELELD